MELMYKPLRLENISVTVLTGSLGRVQRRPRPEGQPIHEAAKHVPGALVMDSRGIYNVMAIHVSALRGLRDGYDLTLAVNSTLCSGLILGG